MPFTVVKPGVSNIPALFGLQRIKLKNVMPGVSLINKFTKLILYKDFGVKWVGKTPRRKIVLQEFGPLEDTKINAYCIRQYAMDFSTVSVGDVLFVANATIQKSTTDIIHPCQMIFSSESKPDIWVISSSATTSSTTTVDNTSTSEKTTVYSVPSQATSNDSTDIQDQHAALFEQDLYKYRYTPLKDVKVTRSVDVYGVVKFFKPAYKTSGADYCMIITIVDPSIDPQSSGLKCLIFNSDVNNMPKIVDVGDIVRFHRLKVIIYRDGLQGQKTPGFSCLVFARSPEAAIEPRSTTSNYSISEIDKEKVKELREWSKEGGFLFERLKLTLSKVTISQHFDLTCQVIATAASPQQEYFNLKVWDGTKCKLSTFVVDTYQLDGAGQAEVDRIDDLAVDIFIYGQHVEFAKFVSPGDFVRIYNIRSCFDSDRLGDINSGSKVMFVLHDGTSYGRGMVILSKTNTEVRLLMRKLETAVEDALLAEVEDEAVCAQSYAVGSSPQVQDAPDSMSLSKVRVNQYFDLICQVVKTTEMSDSSCICINVWDGTKMNLPCRKMDCSNYSVCLIPTLADSAGPMAEDICLYDNHMENGRKIKPGNFVKVTNLHAARYPPSQKDVSQPPMGSSIGVELALHRGDSFGKNVQVLSADSPLVVPLKRRLDALLGKTPPVKSVSSTRGTTHVSDQRDQDSTTEDQHQVDVGASEIGDTETSQVRAVSSDGGNVGMTNVRDQRKANSTTNKHDEVDASRTGDKDNDRENREERNKASSQALRCMQRFASFTVNCASIKFVSISEAKTIPLPNKFRIRAKVISFLPADVRDFVHTHCTTCNGRCGLSFIKACKVKENCNGGGTKSTRRYSPRLTTLGPSQKVGSEAEVSTSPLRSSMRIRAQLQSMSQPTPRTRTSPVNYQEADSSQSNPANGGDFRSSSQPPMMLRSSPKRIKIDESLFDSQSSNDYETASQGSCQSSLPDVQRWHQRLKVVEIKGKYGMVEIKNVSANDVLTLCKNGLKLSQPPRACLKYVPPSSRESGIQFLCPRCSQDTRDGSKILMNYEYLFKLNLTDDADSLEVIVIGDQATKFLNGLEAENLHKNDSQRNKLARIMELICSDPTSDTAHDPQLECCIQGQTTLINGQDHRIYQLVNTLLANDVTDV